MRFATLTRTRAKRYASRLRRNNYCFQFISISTMSERSVRDGSDIGGDDHVRTVTARRAAAVVDGGCCSGGSFSRWQRAVDYGSGAGKRSGRYVRHRPENATHTDTHKDDDGGSNTIRLMLSRFTNTNAANALQLSLTSECTRTKSDLPRRSCRQCSPQTWQTQRRLNRFRVDESDILINNHR